MNAASYFARGRRLVEEGRSFDALPDLTRAHELEPEDPIYLSFYGLVHGIERGQLGEAIDMCWRAIEGAAEEPDLYLNLARLHLRANQKAEAISVIRAGLTIDGHHDGLRRLIRSLGIRQRPVFPSLPRAHPLNRTLGRLRHQLKKKGSG